MSYKLHTIMYHFWRTQLLKRKKNQVHTYLLNLEIRAYPLRLNAKMSIKLETDFITVVTVKSGGEASGWDRRRGEK